MARIKMMASTIHRAPESLGESATVQEGGKAEHEVAGRRVIAAPSSAVAGEVRR